MTSPAYTMPESPWAILRFIPAFFLGAALIVSIFWMLNAVSSGAGGVSGKAENPPTIDLARLKESFEPETAERKPRPQMPRMGRAPDEPRPRITVEGPSQIAVSIGRMKVDKSLAKNPGFVLSASAAESQPVVKVIPQSPESAASRGREGFVLLEFTVTETGATADPVVVDAQPTGIFDDEAKKAVLKLKYRPPLENGRRVAIKGVRKLMTFKLDH